MTAATALEFSAIEKRFNGVAVLKNVSFSLPAGHTLGLVGENGAGKSTLMNILGGNLAPDAGSMRLDGIPYAPAHPTDAARARVAFIHQELNLFSNLSIAENIFLTSLPRRAPSPLVDRGTLHAQTRALLDQVAPHLSPETPVEELSAGECQLVEIARALSLDARLIIFDEPTTSLSARETTTLFALIRRLRAQGIAMIYISHVLEHVLQLCDDIVVLRDGEVVGQGAAAALSLDQIISQIVGRSIAQLYPTRQGAATAEPLLEVSHVSQPHVVRDISFALHRGEILGLSGLMGAGRSELARMLFGLDPHAAGEVTLNDGSLTRAGPRRRIERGLAFLTEDRRHEGLCLDASIADNIALVSLRQHARSSLRLLDRRTWCEAIATIRNAVQLTARAANEQPVKTLSGGNQQKVVLAKWLLSNPAVLILDEPTRGVDVGARFELYQLILQLADRGAGVIVISSELEELIGLCDRILVMSQGEIRASFARSEFNRERLLEAALPKETTA
jgi:ribose transport system ATP-binding protein